MALEPIVTEQFNIDHEIVKLFDDLVKGCKMVDAIVFGLNVAMSQYHEHRLINTKLDFNEFLEAIDEYRSEHQ